VMSLPKDWLCFRPERTRGFDAPNGLSKNRHCGAPMGLGAPPADLWRDLPNPTKPADLTELMHCPRQS